MSIINQLIEDYGLAAMFFLIFLEYACFPVSSEIILPLAGLAGACHGLSFPLLVLISSTCGLAGTTITYGIGRAGGSPLLERAIRRFPSLKRPILASYRTFGNHGRGAVLLSRLLPLCRTYIGFVAGAMRQPLISYLACSAIGIVIWNSLLTSLGFYFYPYRGIFFFYFNLYKKWILIIGIPLLLFFFFTKFTAPSRRQNGKGRE